MVFRLGIGGIVLQSSLLFQKKIETMGLNLTLYEISLGFSNM